MDQHSKRVLILGGSGLIGSAILQGVLSAGHQARAVARHVATGMHRHPEADWRRVDVSNLATADAWSDLLDDVDAVVNAAGVLQDAPGDDVRRTQVTSMRSLFEAAAQRSIAIVQISAAGAQGSDVPFMATKAEADAALMIMTSEWYVLRPGMVFSTAAHGGSGMLRAIAAMPWVRFEAFGRRIVRTVMVGEIVDAVLLCLKGKVPAREVYDLVSDEQTRTADLLRSFRSWLGIGPGLRVPVPGLLVRGVALLGDAVSLLGWRPAVRSATFAQLSKGVDGDPEPWRRATGRRIRGLPSFLARHPAGVQEVWFARLWLLKPLILTTLSLFWSASGAVALLRMEEAMAILSSRGASDELSTAVVVGGALLDIVLGLGIAVRRTAAMALLGTFVVSAGYAIGSVHMAPDLWLDPLGAMAKVLPGTMLSLVALAILRDR